MLEKLSEALKKATNKIANAIFVDKAVIEEVTKELQRALLSADVNVHLVKEITDKIKEKASDEKIKGVEKREQIIKILYDSILEIIGKEKHELNLKEQKSEDKKKTQTIIMLIGLYGCGKTTTSGKLGLYYSKRGHKVALLGLDVHRPAATDQLEQIAKQNKLACFTEKGEKNPLKIYKNLKSQLEDYDLLIIDTAGRHSLDDDLIKEIKSLNKEIAPDYKILVIQADIGQAAKTQASEFQKALEINGVIIDRKSVV